MLTAKELQECSCVYCRDIGFPALWELKDGLFWIEIPKNGSTAIKHFHSDRKLVKRADRVKKPIIFWRDPIDRFVSLFHHYFIEGGGRFHIGRDLYLKKTGGYLRDQKPQKRLEFLLGCLRDLGTQAEVHHFYPQARFVDTRNFRKFTIYPLEQISSVLNVPRRINKSPPPARIYLGEKRSFLRSLYADDYSFAAKHGIEES